MLIFKTSGISATQACQRYGFERMGERALVVQESINEAQKIREAIEDKF